MYYNDRGEKEFCIVIEDFYCKKFDSNTLNFNGMMKRDMTINLSYPETIRLIGEENKDKIVSNFVRDYVIQTIQFHINYNYMDKLEYVIKNMRNNEMYETMYVRNVELDISNEQLYKIYLYLRGKERREKIKNILL